MFILNFLASVLANLVTSSARLLGCVALRNFKDDYSHQPKKYVGNDTLSYLRSYNDALRRVGLPYHIIKIDQYNQVTKEYVPRGSFIAKILYFLQNLYSLIFKRK